MTQGPLSTELPPEPGDAEARLRLLRDRLEIALRATNDGLWDWDLIEDKVYFSPRFRELLGYDDEQAFHQDFVLRSSLHPDDRDAAAGDIDRHVHGDGPPLDRVYRLRCRDQRYRWFHGRGRVLRGPDGRAQHFAGAITDVTERMAAEEALRASEQRFRELTELSADWFWEQDADLRFTRMIGHTADNMITTPAQHIGLYRWDLPHVDMSDEVWQRHREQLQRHEPFRDFEIRRLDNKGRLTVLHTSGKPVFDAHGTFIGYHGVGRNVTSLHLAETRRSELEEQLRESQKMEAVGTLAGGIAHDFNNILGAIFGHLQLARHALGDEHPVADHLDQIDRSAQRARALVQQILTFSRRGGDQQTRHAQALHPLVAETLSLLRATLPAGVALDYTPPEEPVQAVVNADQLHQMLMNLCINGWHALDGQAGRVTIALRQVELDRRAASRLGKLPPGAYAQLTVSDNGCGMDEATRSRVFEPFFTTRPVGQGTGLGLAVVHGIVAAHRGAIGVRSKPGRGSSFTVHLPANEPEGMVPAPTSQPGGVAQGRGQHVLYIDDDEVMMVMVEGLLQSIGYRATVHGRPAKAVAAVRAKPQAFDVVVTDFNMPGMSGLDVVREIAAIRPDLPVIISSGYLSDELRAEAALFGVVELMAKENSVLELPLRLHRVLNPSAAE
ncbi:MAG: PAS domain-containing protein [Ideonella sp.]|nr:PAS domain-containing protein [Ideonella sp.]